MMVVGVEVVDAAVVVVEVKGAVVMVVVVVYEQAKVELGREKKINNVT